MGRPSKFDQVFKAKVAVKALQEGEPLAVLAKKYHVAPSVITNCKEELLQNLSKRICTLLLRSQYRQRSEYVYSCF